jgi:TetR/AcrR family transcriptional regulator, fatty acid metabolism regulator protein
MSVLTSKRTYKPADQRRQQILDCALQAFAARGYHDTSIADVCSRAGIGRATLYQYFTDKHDLLAALADRIATRVTAAFRQRPELSIPFGFKPTEEQAIAFIQERFVPVLRVVFEDAATARLVLRAGRGAGGVVDDILGRIDAAVLETIETELRQAKAAGVVRPLDERFVARFFVGGMEKILMMYLDEDRPIDVEAIAREAALLEVCGIFSD